MNINQYLLTHKDDGDLTSLSEVDYAIFSLLSYCQIEHFIKEKKESVYIKDFKLGYQKRLIKNISLFGGLKGMVDLLHKRKKYKDITFTDFRSVYDNEKEIQFASMCIHLPNNRIFVTFRGTDKYIIGFKEDLKLAIESVMPASILARDYLNEMMDKYSESTFIVGGHSKGGNLAIYSSSQVSKNKQERIEKIIDLDCPGFNDDLIQSDGYQNITHKIETFVPQSSVVGVIFKKNQPVHVIKAKGIGLSQHSVFNWEFKGNKFKRVKELESGYELNEGFLNKTISQLNKDDMSFYIDTVYGMIKDNTKNLTFNDLMSIKVLTKAYKRYKTLTKAEKKKIKDITFILLKNGSKPYKSYNTKKDK